MVHAHPPSRSRLQGGQGKPLQHRLSFASNNKKHEGVSARGRSLGPDGHRDGEGGHGRWAVPNPLPLRCAAWVEVRGPFRTAAVTSSRPMSNRRCSYGEHATASSAAPAGTARGATLVVRQPTEVVITQVRRTTSAVTLCVTSGGRTSFLAVLAYPPHLSSSRVTQPPFTMGVCVSYGRQLQANRRRLCPPEGAHGGRRRAAHRHTSTKPQRPHDTQRHPHGSVWLRARVNRGCLCPCACHSAEVGGAFWVSNVFPRLWQCH